MFESELFERFSRINLATVFVVWVPVVLGLLYRTWSRNVLSLGLGVAIFAAGLLLWTLLEYVLHRWVFHWCDETALGRRIHFVLHGVHHDYPNDKHRLVMPLGASIPLGAVFYGLFYVTLGQTAGELLFAAVTTGYLVYDGTHYAVHRFKQTTRVGRFVKRHHMRHHHMDHGGGFGVSTPLWDLVFRTMPAVKKPVAMNAAAER